jgi:hypothetical protein
MPLYIQLFYNKEVAQPYTINKARIKILLPSICSWQIKIMDQCYLEMVTSVNQCQLEWLPFFSTSLTWYSMKHEVNINKRNDIQHASHYVNDNMQVSSQLSRATKGTRCTTRCKTYDMFCFVFLCHLTNYLVLFTQYYTTDFYFEKQIIIKLMHILGHFPLSSNLKNLKDFKNTIFQKVALLPSSGETTPTFLTLCN